MNTHEIQIDGLGIATVQPFGPRRAAALIVLTRLAPPILTWLHDIADRGLGHGARLIDQVTLDTTGAALQALADVDPDALPGLIALLLSTTSIVIDRATIQLNGPAEIDRIFAGHERGLMSVVGAALVRLLYGDEQPSPPPVTSHATN